MFFLNLLLSHSIGDYLGHLEFVSCHDMRNSLPQKLFRIDVMLDLALRNTLRNRRRSALTLITVSLGCTLLIVGLSWINGLYGTIIDKQIQQYGEVSLRTERYARYQDAFPTDSHRVNVTKTATELKQIKGVSAAHPIIRQPATLEVDGQIGEVFAMMVGGPVDYFQTQLTLDQHLITGRFFGSESAVEECIIGVALAKEMNISIGDTAYFTGQMLLVE